MELFANRGLEAVHEEVQDDDHLLPARKDRGEMIKKQPRRARWAHTPKFQVGNEKNAAQVVPCQRST